MRVLMCPPIYFEIVWEDQTKNAWQRMTNQPDKDLALKQWADLVAIYRKLGVKIHVLEPKEGLGDMCFTANAAWGRDNIFVLANFKPKERRKETPHHAKWLIDNRFSCYYLPKKLFFEGQGDIVTLDEAYIYGYGVRNSLKAIYHIEKIFKLKKPIIPIRLVSPQFYHADLALHSSKSANAIIYCPQAFDEYDLKRIERLKVKKLELYPDEVIQKLDNGLFNFLLNAVYIGNTEIFPWDINYSEFPKKVVDFLDENGNTEIVPANVSAFSPAGGGPRCLTLFLD